jgi:hypothetical protein
LGEKIEQRMPYLTGEIAPHWEAGSGKLRFEFFNRATVSGQGFGRQAISASSALA